MASITPDPKKRGCLLPPGCKDLIDVLQRRKRKKTGTIFRAARGFVQTRGGTITGRLSDLGQYVAMAYASDALICTLALDSQVEGIAVRLHRGKGVAASASLDVQIGTDRERAVREFVVRHGFPLPVDMGMPAQFRPDLPVYQIYRLAPLSSEASLVLQVVEALFREVAGLDDASELRFRYDELNIAA